MACSISSLRSSAGKNNSIANSSMVTSRGGGQIGAVADTTLQRIGQVVMLCFGLQAVEPSIGGPRRALFSRNQRLPTGGDVPGRSPLVVRCAQPAERFRQQVHSRRDVLPCRFAVAGHQIERAAKDRRRRGDGVHRPLPLTDLVFQQRDLETLVDEAAGAAIVLIAVDEIVELAQRLPCVRIAGVVAVGGEVGQHVVVAGYAPEGREARIERRLLGDEAIGKLEAGRDGHGPSVGRGHGPGASVSYPSESSSSARRSYVSAAPCSMPDAMTASRTSCDSDRTVPVNVVLPSCSVSTVVTTESPG